SPYGDDPHGGRAQRSSQPDPNGYPRRQPPPVPRPQGGPRPGGAMGGPVPGGPRPGPNGAPPNGARPPAGRPPQQGWPPQGRPAEGRPAEGGRPPANRPAPGGRPPAGRPPQQQPPAGRPVPTAAAPAAAGATQRMTRPAPGQRPGSLGEAVAERNRSGPGTGPRPATARATTGPRPAVDRPGARPGVDGPRRAGAAGTGGQRRVQSGPPSTPPPGRGGRGGYGGSGSSGPGRKFPWKTIRRVCYVLVALAIVVPSAVFLFAYSTVSVPEPGDLKTNQVATILAEDGSTVITKVVPPQGNRTDVTIDQVPPHVRNAVIAAEDRDFYTNPGFSISGFARAARDNLLGKESAGGGSTITQQYVKNALVGDERSL